LNENFFANVDGASVVDMISDIEMDSNLLIVLAVMFAVVFLFAVRQCLVSGKTEKYEKIADDKDCYVEGTGYGSIAALN